MDENMENFEKRVLMENDYDDLAELRVLLRKTKKNLKGYGKDLY